MLLYDKNRVQIQECLQLVSISNQQITVKCKYNQIIVSGNDLKIMEFGQQQIIITGKIENIGILYA